MIVFIEAALIMLAYCSNFATVESYQDIIHQFAGQGGLVAAGVLVVIHNYGACATYLVIVADQIDRGKGGAGVLLPIMMTSSNGNIFRVTGPLCGMNSPQKGRWRRALVLSLICARTNGWANNRDGGDLRRHRARYDATVMMHPIGSHVCTVIPYANKFATVSH